MKVNRLAALFGLGWAVAVAQTPAAFLNFTAGLPTNSCLEREASGLPTKVSSPSSVPDRKDVEAFLNDRLAVWQRRLNLQNWKVGIAITPRTGLRSGTIGQVKWDKSKKTALISVMEPAAYKGAPQLVLQDIEFTLVHELVHLELALLPRSESSRRTEEHAVDNIARALMAVHTRN